MAVTPEELAGARPCVQLGGQGWVSKAVVTGVRPGCDGAGRVKVVAGLDR